MILTFDNDGEEKIKNLCLVLLSDSYRDIFFLLLLLLDNFILKVLIWFEFNAPDWIFVKNYDFDI